ncbi:septal ring factor EnvC (AmiA/AmiB activator) [Balneicella halophila]|uniref:Septal ring factor EnvC (AmiA/AmiB activator) n=2 Tax=Balneicella halophila TaxID=1537566 RepID=A0A7L4UQG4_BALHA|nr:septal ring factor EnvC (AmiA/AmiB activator) [Balneicella halophila]
MLLCLGIGNLNAQNVSDLKKKQEKNKKELEYTNKILKSVRTKQSSSLSKLKALQQDIKTRETSVKLYRDEVEELQKAIDHSNKQIQVFNDKQEKLKKVYGELLVSAYYQNGTLDKWIYIFASEDFSQAYNRYKYFEQVNDYTYNQLSVLKNLKDSVNENVQKVVALKTEKESLVEKEQQAQQTLDAKKKEQQKEINRLKAKEKDLLSRLKVQQQRERNLKKQIEKLIARTAKKERKKPPTKADIQLGKSFIANKGKLPWPVDGFISSAFGEHAHPILKTVKVRNDGIDITAQKGSTCKAVFNGEVSQVLSIPGLNSTVIIKHGSYLSVYANLINLYVKKGDKIQTGQSLGKIATGSDGATVMKLQIWKNTSRQNPKYWLRKK